MLKAATYPNPVADRGEHEFTYSLYLHKGRLADGETVSEGYKLNQPLTVLPIAAQSGALPESFSLISTSDPAFVIETIKLAEDGEGIIIRGYESLGGKCRTELSLGFEAKSVELCDLQENKISDLALENGKIKLSISNFEIVTLKIKI